MTNANRCQIDQHDRIQPMGCGQSRHRSEKHTAHCLLAWAITPINKITHMDMQFVETSLLRVGYREWNPQAAKTIVLAHGWPDSIRCWHNVVPELVQAGYRVVAPALRGFLPTTFLSESTPRTGQLSALGRDMV